NILERHSKYFLERLRRILLLSKPRWEGSSSSSDEWARSANVLASRLRKVNGSLRGLPRSTPPLQRESSESLADGSPLSDGVSSFERSCSPRLRDRSFLRELDLVTFSTWDVGIGLVLRLSTRELWESLSMSISSWLSI